MPDGEVAVSGPDGEHDAHQAGLLKHLADGGEDEVLPQLADGARLVAHLEDPAPAVGKGLGAARVSGAVGHALNAAQQVPGPAARTSHIGVTRLRKR